MTPRARQRTNKSSARSEEQNRMRIAAEAARIMAEEGVRDYHTAKRKAAERLNFSETRHLPANEEIEAALSQRLQLFHSDDLARNTRRLRKIAADAMRFLAEFDPRLVGGVLSGTVTHTSEIQLHMSADVPEQVGFFLQQHNIPYNQGERRIRFGGDRFRNVPTYSFTADGAGVELCVFDPRSIREVPLSPVDGRPMRRANLREMEELLDQN